MAEAEFHSLGLGAPVGIAALQGRRVGTLMRAALEPFTVEAPEDAEASGRLEGPRLAVVGRPNVGKSTFINRLLRSERLVTSAEPGTTRDSVLVPCRRGDREFILVDTAGIRRRARVHNSVEKFSVVQSLQAIEDSGVVVLLVDAREGVTEQDLHLMGLSIERGRAITIAVNKWDGVETSRRRQIEAEVDRKLCLLYTSDAADE